MTQIYIYTLSAGIEIMLAFIAGVFTIVIASGNNRSRYISQDREKWRDSIRLWIVEVSQIIYDGWDNNKLQAKKNELLLRLNPTRDTKLMNNIKRLELGNSQSINVLMEIVNGLQLLLKHDWEKVKKNHSLLGGTYLLNTSIIILIIYFIITTKDYFRIDDLRFNTDYFWNLMILFIGKFLINEIEKIPIIREKTTINVFDNYTASINLPSLTEIVVSIIVFVICVIVSKDYLIFGLLCGASIICLVSWLITVINIRRKNAIKI